jgi:hypothetical protein
MCVNIDGSKLCVCMIRNACSWLRSEVFCDNFDKVPVASQIRVAFRVTDRR